MKLIIITGPQAVGKMTVGKELEKITGMKLFHNHMTIDLVSNFFNYSTPEGKNLVHIFREEIFRAVAKSDLKGLIFTYIWNFDIQDDWKDIEKIKNIFLNRDGKVYFVELEADIDERLARNKTELRLQEKPSKRDLKWSENDLLKGYQEKRLNSKEGEIKEKNYIKINNTKLKPEEVARIIKTRFRL